MRGWTTTDIWIVNNKVVIADTIEEAISLYKEYSDGNCEVLEVKVFMDPLAAGRPIIASNRRTDK